MASQIGATAASIESPHFSQASVTTAMNASMRPRSHSIVSTITGMSCSVTITLTRSNAAETFGQCFSTNAMTVSTIGSSLSPSCTCTTSSFALIRSIDRPVVPSIVANASPAAPDDSAITAMFADNCSASPAVSDSTAPPASTLPNMSMTDSPLSAIITIASSSVPPASKNSVNVAPSFNSLNASLALVPSLPSSDSAALRPVAACAVDIPLEVNTATLAPTSSSPTPMAEAIGAT